MRYYVPSQVSVSALLTNFDTNLVIPAGKTIEVASGASNVGTVLSGVIMTLGVD